MSVTAPQTVHELYRLRAAAQGDAPAVKGLNAPDLSYSGFVHHLDKVADTLGAEGIGRGDRVLIRLPNGPEPFVAMHAVAAVAVGMLVDPQGSAVELERLLRFVTPKALILRQGADDEVRTLAQHYAVRILDLVPTPEAGAGSFALAEPVTPRATPQAVNGPDDLSYLLATSGTTSQPRLVPNSQRVMLVNILVPTTRHEELFGETIPLHLLNYLPLHMSMGLNLCSAALASGGSIACMPRFEPQAIFEWLDVYRPTFLHGPPALFEQLLALAPLHQDVLSRYRPRYIFSAAASLPESVQAGIDSVFKVPIIQGYGMTEVGGVSRLVLPPGAPPAQVTGRVTRPEDMRIMAADGTLLAPGQVGEIVVRTSLFDGYWNNPEATAEAFIDGWFRTGDEGRIDAEGCLTVVGRVKEVINSGGAKVSPSEVEAVLKQHPQVKDAVVFGLKHAEMGETVAAVVVGDTNERELRKFASERLPFYKVPLRIVFVAEIPRAGSGKVQRNRLAELLGLT